MVTQTSKELIVIEAASSALAQANSIHEIKEIRDKAEAVRKYAQNAALGLNAQNHAAEVKLRAERKAGKLLARLPLRGGDRKSNSRMDCLKLENLGISQNQSTRWQLQASLSEREFEEYLRSTRDSGREISTSGILRLARQASKSGIVNRNAVVDASSDTSRSAANGQACQSLEDQDPLLRIGNGLTELSHHRALLGQLLRPLYSDEQVDLLPAQRRVLGHILREMQVLIEELQRVSTPRQVH
jgi:hypothetical protein